MWDAFVGFMINVLLYIYSLLGQNFGIAIIVFTIVVRLATHPLTVKQLKGSTAMAEMQKDKRWIEAQKKYKNDKEKLSQEQMKLYQELGINPLASCLPTLIQLPIIIALYQAVIQSLTNSPLEVLKLTNHIYTGFLNIGTLLPLNNRFLWMDLGTPDLIHIPGLPFPIPILAILVVITTYIQSKLTTPPPASPDDQSAQISGMMTIYMPLLMGYMAFTLASGLSLYFVASNIIGILQYAALGKVNWRNLLPSRKPAKA
ncbi:YidC/Oxa1 family membrane protein insertase [Leptolinea tardivitalis]|uniref:YidC/Oxa1 family membrane protein insertase n=1 Tax=Leptolinea tardivitalis TaxID=229920 RepID=UPI000783CEE2|nr:YidC/Oxa1 family membrane protein insertase [Leptolinea tardivitalis]GAP20044.1 membrane protein insertase [Leptolinea tardivitalis]